MGGEQAIAATGSDPRIRAVVAEGVTRMQVADHGWLTGQPVSASRVANEQPRVPGAHDTEIRRRAHDQQTCAYSFSLHP